MREIDEALERIAKLGGEGLVRRMVGAFLENAEGRVGAACEVVDAGALDSIARAAHSLRSSAGNVGAARLVELAREIEERSRELETLVGELPEALAEAGAHLKGRVAERQGSSDEEDSGR